MTGAQKLGALQPIREDEDEAAEVQKLAKAKSGGDDLSDSELSVNIGDTDDRGDIELQEYVPPFNVYASFRSTYRFLCLHELQEYVPLSYLQLARGDIESVFGAGVSSVCFMILM